jgi:hypothetical protein
MPGVAASARALRDTYGGSFDGFWTDFRSRPAFTKRADHELLNIYCMAACYSAEEDGTVTLPFEPHSGAFRPEVWERWLANDPVRMAADHGAELQSMRAIYLDAGRSDEYFLDVGATAFAAELEKLGVDYHLELFEGSHRSFEYRYPIAWKFLAERIGASTS